MKLPICVYPSELSLEGLSRSIKLVYDQLRTLSEGRIDAFNVAPSLAGDGLEFSPNTSAVAGQLISSLANSSKPAYLRLKEDTVGTRRGVEAIVDASDATNGRVCVLDKDFLSQQLISLIPQDPASIANPGGTFKTPYGDLSLDTGASFNLLFKTNGSEAARIDSTGKVGIGITPSDHQVDILSTLTGGAYALNLYANPASSGFSNGVYIKLGANVNAFSRGLQIEHTGTAGTSTAGIARILLNPGSSLSSSAIGQVIDVSTANHNDRFITGLHIIGSPGSPLGAPSSTGSGALLVQGQSPNDRTVDFLSLLTGGTMASLRYGASTTRTGAVVGWDVDLATDGGTADQLVTAIRVRTPAVATAANRVALDLDAQIKFTTSGSDTQIKGPTDKDLVIDTGGATRKLKLLENGTSFVESDGSANLLAPKLLAFKASTSFIGKFSHALASVNRTWTMQDSDYTVENTGHASKHKNGGADEVATATPGNNEIVKAGGSGTIADGWLSSNIPRLDAAATFTSTVQATAFRVSGTQVVSSQGAAVADATDAASTMARLNDLLARLRTHGLIAT